MFEPMHSILKHAYAFVSLVVGKKTFAPLLKLFDTAVPHYGSAGHVAAILSKFFS
jgi:hypothetical protein